VDFDGAEKTIVGSFHQIIIRVKKLNSIIGCVLDKSAPTGG
jgi:hypothetical protein